MGGFSGYGGSTPGWFNFNGWLDTAWGSGQAFDVVCNFYQGATNLVFGTNPPYYLDDFLSIYPKFFGLPTAVSGCGTVAGSNVVTVPSLAGLNTGQFVQAAGTLPKGSVITQVGTGPSATQAATHGEAPFGATPGTTFTLTTAPPNGTLQTLTANGLFLRPVLDYTLTGNVVTLTNALPNGSLYATWTVQTQASTVHGETPSGSGTSFTLSGAPPNGVLSTVSANGLFLTPGTDYTLSGTALTLINSLTHGWLYVTWLVQAAPEPLHVETPMGMTPGTTFILSTPPSNGQLQSLTANGVFLTPVVDYNLYGNAIVLTSTLAHGSLTASWLYQPITTVFQVTVNQPAILTSSNATLMVYEAPPIPTTVILMYLNLAASSLVQLRWQDDWCFAVSLFIAHYCTLYAKSDAAEVQSILQDGIHGEAPSGAVPGTLYTLSAIPPSGTLQALYKNGQFLTPGGVDYTLLGNTVELNLATAVGDTLYVVWPVQSTTFSTTQATGASIAAQGLAGGIQASKSVGDVSVSYQVLTSLEDWGAWNLTLYGQQLATLACVIGAGPMVIY